MTKLENLIKSIPAILWTISMVYLVIQITNNAVDKRFVPYLLIVALVDLFNKKYLGAILGVFLSAILFGLMSLGIL